jgi:hypothetical protein
MRGFKPLWLRIKDDWLHCDDATAQAVATSIIRRNPFYWALSDYDLEAWSKEILQEMNG